MLNKPYVSFVIASRNDYDDSLNRLNFFLKNLNIQLHHYKLYSEVIIVDWNPPDDRPKLSEKISAGKISKYVTVRIIEVSQKIHCKFKNSDKINMFQMIAKNAGIVRAKGKYILATNIDIVFSDEIIKYIASGEIKKGFCYRLNRFDVSKDVMKQKNLKHLLKECNKTSYKLYTVSSTRNLKNYNYLINMIRYNYIIFKNNFRNMVNIKPAIHTNAAGDFTLMSKEDWKRTRGYSELPIRSFKIDSYLLHVAHHLGIKQKLLDFKYKIYHIDHASRSDGLDISLKKVDNLVIDRKEYFRWIKIMELSNNAYFHNSEKKWGLKNIRLPEIRIH